MAIFSDFNNSFAVHPVKKDLSLKTDADSVKQAVMILILTDKGERLMQPRIGCKIRSLLFENFSAQTIILIKSTIIDTITQYEPRAIIENVKVSADPDNNNLNVSILFSLINNSNVEQLDLILERIR